MLEKFNLVDYLKILKQKYNNDGLSSLSSNDLIKLHNDEKELSPHDKIKSEGGQFEYYTNHKEFGYQFESAKKALTDFLFKYPDVPKHLITNLDGDEGFPSIPISSDDEKEVHMWKNFSFEEETKHEIEVPFVCNTISSKKGDIHLVKNANWRELEDPYRLNNDGLGSTYWRDIYLSDENQSPMDIFKQFITNNSMVFKSLISSNLDSDCEDEERKITILSYPILHPRVKTYLGLLKKFIGIILKLEKVRYNSIDLIPINDNDIAIYVSSNDAEKINSDFKYMNSKSMKEVTIGNVNDNIIHRISNAYTSIIFQDENNNIVDEDDLTNDHLYFVFYKRDRSLRFQSIMSSRVDRIRDSIRSLNKLHNPTNYKFEESDFENAFTRIRAALRDYEKEFKKYFEMKNQKNNSIPKEKYEKIVQELEKYKNKEKEKKSE